MLMYSNWLVTIFNEVWIENKLGTPYFFVQQEKMKKKNETRQRRTKS
jgi:hypothetical protein